ncbi:MAG TPA: DinB family protein [Terriglobia bacterium]|jgi:uncharacterized damage-inducible protein DinB|nr:DinB family protein [Terriglobia bacterium]
MEISELLLSEFEQETAKTRALLERVPAGKGEYVPHPKSMPLGKLAAHIVELTGFGLTVLTTPELNFSAGSFKPLPFESGEQLVKVLEEDAAKVRGALSKVTDHGWQQTWKLLFDSKLIFEGSRFLAYREMFVNHVVHHRAQLGVYLRLNEIPIPGTYGPSADEPWKG